MITVRAVWHNGVCPFLKQKEILFIFVSLFLEGLRLHDACVISILFFSVISSD